MESTQLLALLLAHGIKPETIDYKGEQRIKLEFEINSALANAVKQIPGRLWSRTLKAWHIPREKKLVVQLIAVLDGLEKNSAGAPSVLKLPVSQLIP